MNKKRINILLPGIVFLGIILRIYKLGKHNFWIDEIMLIEKATNLPSFGEILSWAVCWMCPPFYAFFMHFWIKLFGHSEISFRLPSVIFGVLTILLIYKVGKTLFSRQVGVLSAYLLAISPFHIIYSQEGKMYTLLPFLGLLSMYFLYKLLIRDKNSYWIGYFISNVILIYTHNWGLFLFISENIYFVSYLLLVKKDKCKVNIKKYLMMQALIILLYLPWTYVLFKQFKAVKTYVCIVWVGFMHIPATFACFSGKTFRIADNWLETKSYLCILGTMIYSLLFYRGIFWKYKKEKVKEILLLFSCFFLTLIIPFLVSLKTPIYDFSKHTIIVLPVFCLIVGYGLSKIKSTWWKVLIIIVLLLNSFPVMHKYYFLWTKSNGRAMAEYVQRNSQEKDMIVIIPEWIRYIFCYYYQGNLKIVKVKNFMPGEVDRITRLKEDMKKERLILVFEDFWQHPEVRFLKEQLEKRFPKKVSEKDFGNKKILILQAEK